MRSEKGHPTDKGTLCKCSALALFLLCMYSNIGAWKPVYFCKDFVPLFICCVSYVHCIS